MNLPSWLVLDAGFAAKTLFARALAATLLGVGCALLLFPSQASIIGVVLTAFAQAETVNGLLDRNRDEVWGGEVSTFRANLRLAQALLATFLGVFVAYVLAVQIAPERRLEACFGEQLGSFVGGSVTDIDFGTFVSLLRHNALVLVGSFLFALVYQHAGMLLILAWNAARWGVVFSYIARRAGATPDVATVSYLASTVACILPHLVLEATAYVLAAMSGVFLSRGGRRYALTSTRFMQVGYAVLRIGATGVLFLLAAVAFEAHVTPRLVGAFFGG